MFWPYQVTAEGMGKWLWTSLMKHILKDVEEMECLKVIKPIYLLSALIRDRGHLPQPNLLVPHDLCLTFGWRRKYKTMTMLCPATPNHKLITRFALGQYGRQVRCTVSCPVVSLHRPFKSFDFFLFLMVLNLSAFVSPHRPSPRPFQVRSVWKTTLSWREKYISR